MGLKKKTGAHAPLFPGRSGSAQKKIKIRARSTKIDEDRVLQFLRDF
jgi:hypothetical protein